MNLSPQILEDDLVQLIPLTEKDFDALFLVASDPLIWEQHPTPDRYKREVFKMFFDNALASGSAFLLYDKKSGYLIGTTRYYDYKEEERVIAIGYTFLARKYWGGAYNQAVKKLLLDYAFQFVEKVVFHIGATNIRSQKGTMKLGAVWVRELELDWQGNPFPSPYYEYAIRKIDWIA